MKKLLQFALTFLAAAIMLLALLGLSSALSPLLRAQNVNSRYDNILWTSSYVAGQTVLIPVPGATIQVCTYPANAVPCTNLATLYAGPTTLGGQANNPTTTDAQGNFGFWAAAGYYVYTVTNSLGQSAGPYAFTLGGSSGGGGGGALFPSSPGIVYSTSTTTAINASSAQLVSALNSGPTSTFVPSLLPLALQNGTTATTQTQGDNSAQVATDAFVLANTSLPCNSVANGVQFNNGGSFGCSAGLTFASNILTVPQVDAATLALVASGGSNAITMQAGSASANYGMAWPSALPPASPGGNLNCIGGGSASTCTWAAPAFQSLTTTGSSGAATLTSGVLNIPQYSGGGTPGGSSTQAQFNNSGSFAGAAGLTFNSSGAVTQFAKVQYLSAASDIGAQCNAAVTALSNTGVIVLPNSTSIPMSTTCTNIPPGITIKGYGKLASIVDCTVAGDCFQFLQNPTTAGEIASTVSDFGIIGSGASNQVLMHFNGASGYTLHDLQFEPYAGSGNAAVCLEFDNSATGLFTERNRSYNVFTERQCTTGVLFNQGGESDTSFAYNTFEFSTVSTGSNYAVVFNGNGILYGGSISVTANHVGPGGGVMQFNNGFQTGTTAVMGNEVINISAEENGSGAGVVLAATGTNALNFTGTIQNGPGGAPALATTYSIGGSATLQHNETGFANSTTAYLSQSTKPIAMEWDGSGDVIIPNGSLSVSANVFQVGGSSFTPSGNIAQFTGNWAFGTTFGLSNTSTGGEPWGMISGGSSDLHGVLGFSNGTNWPFSVYEVGSGAPQIFTLANGSYSWNTATTYPSTNAQAAGFSQSSGTVSCDTGTVGNSACALKVGTITVASARKGTFVCTAAGTITIANANELVTSDVVISLNTAGGTISTAPAMKTVTSGTGFTVLCGASDTSTYNYDILN